MRRSSGTLQFLLNGKLLSYSSSTAPHAPTDRFTIGNMFAGDNSTLYLNSFNGQIDEVSVWNAALTDAQVRDAMCRTLEGDENNLVTYYNFDNSSGTKLQSFDGGGNGNDLTLVNMSDDDWVTSTAFNTWLNTNDATWSTTTNWSRGSVPGSTENVGIYSYSSGTDVSISGSPTVNNFVVASSTTLTVSSGLTVAGNLVLNSNLDPNGQVINLSSTGTLIEGSGVFYGTSGYITTTRDLSNIDEDVAGLGAKITTSSNMGSTTIKRAHATQTNSSNNSVKRYYDITPTTNTGLDATLVFNYNTEELNSLTEADLELYKSTDDGSSWTLADGTVSVDNNTVTLTGIESFSRWTLFDGVAAVPVELVSFSAKIIDQTILLNWETATEVNNYGFEVESKRASTDEWKMLGFIQGHGNSNSPKYYEFIDEEPLADSAEYRLKQIDTDGAFTYYAQTVKVNRYGISDVEEVIPTEFSLAQNYPNPFNPSTTINYGLKLATNVQLIVYNVLGQEVITLVNQHQKAGNYSVNFDASNLSSGAYIYKIIAGDFVSVKKLLLMK